MEDATNPPVEEQPAEQAAPGASTPPEEVVPDEVIALEELPEVMQTAAKAAGWTSLRDVQARTIPAFLKKRDLMVQSRTGSGKTGAFLLPLILQVRAEDAHTQALILVPTRELAVQVAREGEILTGGSGVRSVAVYGGVGYGPQIEAFKEGAHIVIGTPGRILDHLMNRSLNVTGLKSLVFDEADRMMSMGFYPDMLAILRYLPTRRSTYMFSATYPTLVHGLAKQFMRDPDFLSLSHGNVHVAEMEHIFYEVNAMDKDRILVRLLEVENPASAIIFCNRKDRVNYVATVLQRFGYDADQLTADLAQSKRESVLSRLRENKLRFLVATDIAARGIDIANLSHVILYEFPEDSESYIHRAGRTARGGAAGTAISLVSYQEAAALWRAARMFKIDLVQREAPTDADVEKIVAERATSMLEADARNRDKLQTERMRRFHPLVAELANNPDELPLLAMLLDNFYHQKMHNFIAPPPDLQPQASSGGGASRPSGEGSGSRGPRRRRTGGGRQ